MPTQDRNTGETTRQMKAAPLRAVYIWPLSDTRYAMNLSRFLGRSDLEIVSSDYWFDQHRWQGRELTGLVIDHACRLTVRQWEMLPYIRACVRLKPEQTNEPSSKHVRVSETDQRADAPDEHSA